MSVSMSFKLNISNMVTQRLRFEINEGNSYAHYKAGDDYSWVMVTRNRYLCRQLRDSGF